MALFSSSLKIRWSSGVWCTRGTRHDISVECSEYRVEMLPYKTPMAIQAACTPLTFITLGLRTQRVPVHASPYNACPSSIAHGIPGDTNDRDRSLPSAACCYCMQVMAYISLGLSSRPTCFSRGLGFYPPFASLSTIPPRPLLWIAFSRSENAHNTYHHV